MTIFTAVSTTGIYCRPGCPARTPKPGNARRFATAAAAEAAGYRACWRCRPYQSPPPNASGSPELVCRAVRMILAGELDGRTELQLGARLGVSGRHLRRLFARCVGCTPTQLACSARVHFAHRLLDETDWPVSEIAFGCGYGSVRQLSRDCRAIFRATPTELRARRRKPDRNVADGGLALRLPFQPPLAWPVMLDRMMRGAIPGVEAVAGGSYRRLVDIDGDPGMLEFSLAGPDCLLLRAHLPHWGGLMHVVTRARAIFGLDADYEGAARRLQGDELLGPLLARHPGLRPHGRWDPFESAVLAVLAEDTDRASSQQLLARIVSGYGAPVPGLAEHGLSHMFPVPAALADANLRRIGCSDAQAAALTALAQAALDGALRPAVPGTLAELLTSLLAVPGLTAAMAQDIAAEMGEADAHPAADRVPASVRAEAWRPFRAFAASYLALLAPAGLAATAAD